MDTLTAIRKGEIETPFPLPLLFGGLPLDSDVLEIFVPKPRWDEDAELDLDETLGVRCCSY